jgi:hypothetical protein
VKENHMKTIRTFDIVSTTKNYTEAVEVSNRVRARMGLDPIFSGYENVIAERESFRKYAKSENEIIYISSEGNIFTTLKGTYGETYISNETISTGITGGKKELLIVEVKDGKLIEKSTKLELVEETRKLLGESVWMISSIDHGLQEVA